MKRRIGLLFALTVSVASCVSGTDAVDYGDPTERNVASEDGGIIAYVVSPTAATTLDKPVVELVISAYTTEAPQPLTVKASTRDSGTVVATASGAPGRAQRFNVKVPLLHGPNSVQISIESDDGKKFRRLSYVVLYDGAPPGLAFQLVAPNADGTCAGAPVLADPVTNAATACARGLVTTAEGRTATGVAVGPKGVSAQPAMLSPNGTWEAIVPLTAGAANVIVASVTDSGGRSASVERSIQQDPDPPTLTVAEPTAKPLFTDAPTVTISGTADDAHGLASLRVETPGGYVQAITNTTHPSGGGTAWTVDVALVPGTNDFSVVARDRAGNEQKVKAPVVQNRTFRLGPPAKNQGATQLSLDRTALSSLIPEADQKTLNMADIPLRPAIVATLQAIRSPEKFGVDTTTWGAPEKNMNRLLNMTPDNANLNGSSIEELLGIATAVGLPTPSLLGDLLGIDVTTTFVDLELAADVVLEKVIGTHPNVIKDAMGKPILRITMYDVFQDLHTVGPKFGPSGQHPGFLVGATESKALQPGFQMSLPVKSNLTKYEGIDASAQERSAVFLLEGTDVLSLDFTSPDFSIAGLTDEPAIDLQMKITENPAFLKVGADKMGGPDAANPGFFRGDGGAWGIPPWQIEQVIAEVAYRQNSKLYAPTYQKTLTYDAGSIKKAATIGWDRGWVTLATAGGIGAPPPPQYAWDLLSEVAQIRLHDGGVAEGSADLGFTLKKLPVGLTADELVAKIKPSLQSQSPQLSKLIAGNGGLASSSCDLFYVPKSQGGGGFLFFRAKEDDKAPFPYATPGFFSDAALKQKVSSTQAQAGTTDAVHEKVDAKAGLTVYFQDEMKKVYSLNIVAADAKGVDVRVVPVGP